MRVANNVKKPMSKDEYICKAFGIYYKEPNPKIQQRMRDRVRASFDNLYGEEELYENAKGRGKKKLDKWWKKTKKNIKEAADKVGDAAKEVGKTVAKASGVPLRQAARGLIEINFRGIASNLHNLNAESIEKVKKNWSNAGGERGKLEESIEIGRKRKPLACGKKCKAKSGYKGFDGDMFYAMEPATASLIAAGAGLLATVTDGLIARKNMKDQQAYDLQMKELENEEKEEDKTPLTPDEQKQADEAAKELLAKDPRTVIQNNPNLTEDEKVVAINELNKVLSDPTKLAANSGMSQQTKTLMIVGGILLVVGLGFLALRAKK